MPDTTTKAVGPHTAALCRTQGQSKAMTVRAMFTNLLEATGY